jgi:PAS domain S-box-containing protein
MKMSKTVKGTTESKQQQDTESHAAAFYTRSLIEASPDPLVTISPEGKITDVNKAFEDITGVLRKRLSGRDFSDFFTDPAKARAGYKQVFSQGMVKDYPLTIRHTSGRTTDVLYNASVYKNEAGEVQGVFASARDITERKEAEAGMEKTRKELAVIKKTADAASEFAESVINTVREPLISLDQDLRVVTVSRSFYDFFKVKPKDTVGQLIYDLGNKQWDIPKLRELLETILPQKASFDNFEVEHEFANIGRRVMLLNARQIQQGAGKERIILLAIEDITERKEIETGLEKARKELAVIKKTADAASEFAESMINTVREPLISLDQDLRVVTVSRSFCDFFKVKPEETVGQLIYDLGNKQWDIPKLRELLETILPKKASFDNYEVEHEFANIGRRIMLLNARQIQQGAGKERIILLAIEDITERKRSDEEMKKYREQLEETVKQRTEKLTNVLSQVKDTVNVLGTSSSEILASTTEVASSAAENAAAIAETTTTVEEVRQAVQLSSQKAKNVSDSAQRVEQISRTGQKAVEETADGMRNIREQMESIAQTIVRLSEQGQSIGGIIASVTDIADQSNLLAVNAAIEAARAGEQGKVFAVVAQEIKSLAEQSKQATTEVRTILNDIQKVTSAAVMATEQGSKAVEAGVKQSAQAGEAIRALVESITAAVQASTQIVASSQQQVVGMNQIGTAMENVNLAGTETAMNIKQVEAAAKNLYELGQKLRELVEQVKM